jgi:sugar/nucleoside kinase (ribokinase family)
MFVTCGGHGVVVIDDSGQRVIPARNQPNPVDICGAGDSFSAAAGLALAATSDPVEAARFGNWAASVTIMKKGTGTVNAAELLAASQA